MREVAGLAAAAALSMVSGAYAQRGPTAAAPSARAVPFQPGEKLTYDVSWSSFVTAGTATVQVVSRKPSFGSIAYYIVAEGRPTPLLSNLYTLYYKVDTLLDVFTLFPQRASVYSQEGKRQRMKTTVFEGSTGHAKFSSETRNGAIKLIPIPPDARDPLSALYVLRSLSLKPGAKMSMPICDDGMSYRVSIEAGGIEEVQTALGSIAAQHVVLSPPPQAGPRAIELWMSTDAAHVPVKLSARMSVGTFVLTLTSRSSGT